MFNCPQTRPDVLALIERVRNYVMTPAEIKAQRLSFVYGQMGHKSKLTKDEIRAAKLLTSRLASSRVRCDSAPDPMKLRSLK